VLLSHLSHQLSLLRSKDKPGPVVDAIVARMYYISYNKCCDYCIACRGEGYSTSELLNELPEKLKDEVIFNELGEIVQNIPLFEGTGVAFLKKLLKSVVTNFHCPGDFIFRTGDLGEELYLVKKGFVEFLSDDLSCVVNRLGTGGYFGEVCSYVCTDMCMCTYLH